MKKKIILTLLITFLTLTACSQVRGILQVPVEESPSTPEVVSKPSFTLNHQATQTAGPTFTSSPSPSLTLTFTPRPTRTPRPTQTPSATLPPIIRVGPDNFPDYVNPLTGLVPANPLLLDRLPIAVKVPNYPHYVYPQSGLSFADQIYEYHLEQGLTRFIAIFYGNDALTVGPIRSGRIFDAHIIQMFNAVYVFNYAYREEGNEALDVYGYLENMLNKNLFVVDPGGTTDWMWRDNSIPSYNNLFANTYNVSELITQRGIENVRQDLATNYFTTLGARGKNKVSVINVNYSYANYAYWEYDRMTNRYYRFQGNVDLAGDTEPEYIPLTDATNDQPIAADNVIILFVPHSYLYKSGRSEVFDIQLENEGKAWVFRNGTAFEAIWERREVHKPLYIRTIQGGPFPLKPGVTFFQVFHTESDFYKPKPDEWTFEFIRPEDPNED